MAELELDIPAGEPDSPEEVEEVFREKEEEAGSGSDTEPLKAEEESEEEAEEEEEKEDPPVSRAQQRIQSEIARRKALEAELEKNRAQIAAIEERFAKLQEPKKPELPDFEDDPAAHLKLSQDEMKARFEEFLQSYDGERKLHEEQQQRQAFVSAFQAEEREFASKVDDYNDAVRSLYESEMARWKAARMSPADAERKVAEDLHLFIQTAKENGESAPELLYKLARERAPRQSPAESVERQRENVSRSRSIGTRGAKERKLTIAEIAELPDSEFVKLTEGDKWDELLRSA